MTKMTLEEKKARVEQYRKCAAKGMTQKETAQTLGVKARTVSHHAVVHGIQFKPMRPGRYERAQIATSGKPKRKGKGRRFGFSADAIARFDAKQGQPK